VSSLATEHSQRLAEGEACFWVRDDDEAADDTLREARAL